MIFFYWFPYCFAILNVLKAANSEGIRVSYKYEIWASDQSNSLPGIADTGLKGGWLWIYDSDDVMKYMETGDEAIPLSCSPSDNGGPCNMVDVFPGSLKEYDLNGDETSNTLGDDNFNKFGRLHGVLKDRFNLYVTASFFTPQGGYIGIIDTTTKEAIGLFRVTEFSNSGLEGKRSVHMSTWTADGSRIIVANLMGKALECIDVVRNNQNKITGLYFNSNASIGLGKNIQVTKEATYFYGNNAFSRPFVTSGISGDYSTADLGDLTPNFVCKENGCDSGIDGQAGGRENNVPICPIPSSRDNGYVTLGGGGMFVVDLKSTPLKIIGEYGRAAVYGAGCGGVEIKNQVFINSGVSASPSGIDQSMFALYTFDDTKYKQSEVNRENDPMPTIVYQDTKTNTKHNGNIEGVKENDSTGQLPGVTTRRDSHGAWATRRTKKRTKQYVHVNDRIRNTFEVFDEDTYERSVYDLVSKDGKSGRDGPSGPCFSKSVMDDSLLPLNDPAPDLMDITPDGKHFIIALRGPVPVSASHSAQGSCPGVGIVKILEGGKSGKLIEVIRSTNTIDTSIPSVPGGHPYSGSERSDIHGAIVVPK